MFRKVSVVMVALLMFVLSIPAVHAEDVKIPEKLVLDAGKGELVLNGSGIRRKFGFKVYEGALYLLAKSTDSNSIIGADEPMAITMSWKRQGPLDKTTEVFSEGFKYGAGADYDSIKGDIDKFLKTLVKAEKQDVWKYVYIPGTGTTIYYNDKPAATIEGLKFKKALFSVWLLENDTFTGDAQLRKGMLGK